MPKDGTVHQLTSNVMSAYTHAVDMQLYVDCLFQTMLFLEQLLDQMDVAGGILAEQGSYALWGCVTNMAWFRYWLIQHG